MTIEAEIHATYVGNQPLLTILEANLDQEKVAFRRSEIAVKAIFPIDLVITAASIYAFEKLILDPILDPIAEKFNWVKSSRKLLKPHQPFNITVRISDYDFIEAPLEIDHDLVSQIWRLIRQTINICRSEGILNEITRIRITSDSPSEPIVILYQGAQPYRKVIMGEDRTVEIPKNIDSS